VGITRWAPQSRRKCRSSRCARGTESAWETVNDDCILIVTFLPLLYMLHLVPCGPGCAWTGEPPHVVIIAHVQAYEEVAVVIKPADVCVHNVLHRTLDLKSGKRRKLPFFRMLCTDRTFVSRNVA
jgi:hypothetical protein